MANGANSEDPGRPGGGQGTALPPALVRAAGAVLVAAGAVHLLRPGALLGAARVAYDRLLDVRFRPRAGARRRVRAVGAAMVAAGLGLLWGDGGPEAERAR